MRIEIIYHCLKKRKRKRKIKIKMMKLLEKNQLRAKQLLKKENQKI